MRCRMRFTISSLLIKWENNKSKDLKEHQEVQRKEACFSKVVETLYLVLLVPGGS